MTERSDILDAIRAAARELGEPLPRNKFLSHSGITEYQMLKHFPSWSAALKAAGVQMNETNVRLDDAELLRDWGEMVRRNREIPTRNHYRREGNYGVNSFANHFGPWSSIPEHFRRFATGKPEWADVIALLPAPSPQPKEPWPRPKWWLNQKCIHLYPTFPNTPSSGGVRLMVTRSISEGSGTSP